MKVQRIIYQENNYFSSGSQIFFCIYSETSIFKNDLTEQQNTHKNNLYSDILLIFNIYSLAKSHLQKGLILIDSLSAVQIIFRQHNIHHHPIAE